LLAVGRVHLRAAAARDAGDVPLPDHRAGAAAVDRAEPHRRLVADRGRRPRAGSGGGGRVVALVGSADGGGERDRAGRRGSGGDLAAAARGRRRRALRVRTAIFVRALAAVRPILVMPDAALLPTTGPHRMTPARGALARTGAWVGPAGEGPGPSAVTHSSGANLSKESR